MGDPILVVGKDPGGTNGAVKVFDAIKPLYNSVRLLANGAAVNWLYSNRCTFEFYPSADEVLKRYPSPEAVITSMCSEGGIGRNLVPLLRGKSPTFALQDYWGARLMTEWSDPKYRPDFIIVNDQLGTDMVLKAWPDFSEEQIARTGYPMFDQYANVTAEDESKAREELENKIGCRNTHIIFFPCGVLEGASELLAEVLGALKCFFGKPFKLIPRVHPRLGMVAPQEFEPWNRQINEFVKEFPGIIVTDANITGGDIKSLILASDLVISDYSTTLLEAGLVGAKLGGKNNISACYTTTVASGFNKECGKLMSEAPFVTLGCTAKAGNRGELVDLIRDGLSGELGLKEAQKKHYQLDGRNSYRAAMFILSMVGKYR